MTDIEAIRARLNQHAFPPDVFMDIAALLAEVERLTARLHMALARHYEEFTGGGCVTCRRYYPCPTARALGVES